VSLARHFRAPIRLPENVTVDVVIVTKVEGRLQHRVIAEELTTSYDDLGLKQERDAFDTLFDHAPDKLQVGCLDFGSVTSATECDKMQLHKYALFLRLSFNHINHYKWFSLSSIHPIS
jgi:hypothetical protein